MNRQQYSAVKAYDRETEDTHITRSDDNFIVDVKRYDVPLQMEVYRMIAPKRASLFGRTGVRYQ